AAEITRTIERMGATLARLAAADEAGDGQAHARALRERGQATVELNRLVGMFDRLTRQATARRARSQAEPLPDEAVLPGPREEPASPASPPSVPMPAPAAA